MNDLSVVLAWLKAYRESPMEEEKQLYLSMVSLLSELIVTFRAEIIALVAKKLQEGSL